MAQTEHTKNTKFADAFVREDANEAIMVPEGLYTDDGRELCIRKWEPVVEMDSIVSVKVEAIIRIPDGD